MLNFLFYIFEYIIKIFVSIYEEFYVYIVNKYEYSYYISGKDIFWYWTRKDKGYYVGYY